MPKLTHDEAIRQYYEEVKDQYPEINFTRFEAICKAPFEFIKHCIRQDSLPVITIKFFGKIRTYSLKIKRVIFIYTHKVRNSKEDAKASQYQDKITFLNNYLEELKVYDTRNKETKTKEEID